MQKKKYYPEVNQNLDFAKMEEEILKFWQDEKVFEKSVAQRNFSSALDDDNTSPVQEPCALKNHTHCRHAHEEKGEFVFYDGPPFANGLPHYGHLLTGFIKDLVARYQTMKGKKVERRFGWDTHGLPVEMETEKELTKLEGKSISGQIAIKEYGIQKFNEACEKSVMKYADEWENYVTRQGRFVDFKNSYKTMDLSYMESVLWAFKQLHEKGLLYEDFRVVPYSWACQTPLSNFETQMDNSYRQKASKAVSVKFELISESVKILLEKINFNNSPLEGESKLHRSFGGGSEKLSNNQNFALRNYNSQNISKSQDLRSNMTDHETKLWYKINDNQLGFKFRRQQPIGNYIVDFVCLERNLVIELDGSGHSNQIEYDKKRDEFLTASGFRVLRIWNNELDKAFDETLDYISALLRNEHMTPHRNSDGVSTPPQGGSGSNESCFTATEGLNQSCLTATLAPQGGSYPRIFLVAWTTTPWTLPSNLALAVGEKIEYATLKIAKSGENQSDEILIIAKDLVEKFTKDLGEFEEVGSIMGQDLIGFFYEPIFPFFKPENNQKIADQCGDSVAFRILHGDFVSTDQGTGIVHIAPGFGEDDQLLCKANGIPTICPVDEGGKFTAEIFDLPKLSLEETSKNQRNLKIKDDIARYNSEGGKPNSEISDLPELSLKNRQVFDTNDDIIRYLKATNSWLKTEQILHNYPHCWRTDTPLIYKAIGSWYVKVTAFKDRMVELNQEINWIPSHIKDGQFGKWLENARDWSITRNRFWGCPVPVWKSKSGKIKVFGSIEEIEEQVFRSSGKKITIDNLHRPFIDEIKFTEDGEEFTRVSDVLDCWFESGSMPYAQVHYPFENKEWFEENFPADFITEYVAQTRGWFYTLMVLSTALFDRAPFKNVICHGTILDENSQKLSKRLRNYADPLEIFSTIGSDAMRFYMISQPVMRGQELRIDKEGKAIRDTLRLSIKPLMNAFNFFCLYANADGILAKRIELKRDFSNVLDRYILAKLKSSVIKIDQAMSAFDTVIACEEFNKFFEVLNNWYIRRSRQRFWRSCVNDKIDEDKQDAYDVLLTVLLTMCEACAPLLPFTCEFVWRNLQNG